MVRALFLAGHDTVILDTTATTKHRRKEWESKSWKRKYQLFNTPKIECVRRAHASERPDLIPIIEKMDAQFETITEEDCDQ